MEQAIGTAVFPSLPLVQVIRLMESLRRVANCALEYEKNAEEHRTK